MKMCGVGGECECDLLENPTRQSEQQASDMEGYLHGLETRAQKLVCCRCCCRAGGSGRFRFLTGQQGLTFPSNFLPELAGSADPITLLLSGGTPQVPFRCLLFQRSVNRGGGYDQLLVCFGSVFELAGLQLLFVLGHGHPNEQVWRVDHFEVLFRPPSGKRPGNHPSNRLGD